MSAQAARNPTDPGLLTAHSSSQFKNGHDQERNDGITPLGESPDLLRWRADMLMDEMMLGAIDVYAGEPKVAPVSTSAPVYPAAKGHQPTEPTYAMNAERPLPTARPMSESGKNGVYHRVESPNENGSYSSTPPASSAPAKGYRENGYTENGRMEHERSENIGGDRPTPRAASFLPSPEPAAYGPTAYDGRRVNQPYQNSPTSQPSPAPAVNQPQNREPKAWVFSAEARYQQIAREQHSTELDETAPANFTSTISIPPAAPRWMPDEPAGLPPHRPETQHSPLNNGAHSPELGPVRRTVAQVTNAMATPATSGPVYGAANGVANRNSKWSNLLPRMSNTDVQTQQQEITTLHSEINALLPPGHDSNKRAQHLLEKAQTILENDPSRSAEVEYYLQQVRTIFQRVQQTIHWSNLYRQRLMLYLAAWSLLAVIVLVARYLYQAQIEGLLADLANWATDSFAVQNFTTWLSTLAAGALGSAVGALLNLRLRSRLEHGFFDRKYSLRGLILPIMGLLFGLLLYLVIGPFFYLFALDPSTNGVLSTLPVLIAFAFGVGQESIYGTRS
ncbi:MAG: hypothetical protein U0350_47800 [Caldilineaceae bacterium]